MRERVDDDIHTRAFDSRKQLHQLTLAPTGFEGAGHYAERVSRHGSPGVSSESTTAPRYCSRASGAQLPALQPTRTLRGLGLERPMEHHRERERGRGAP